MTADRLIAEGGSCDHGRDHELRLRRLDDQSVTGWHRYRVVDVEGLPVGFVAEHHDWMGWRYGGRRWIATHNSSGADWSASWASGAMSTRREALEALRAHLHGDRQQGPTRSEPRGGRWRRGRR
jgi:hypothetical protein